MSTNRAGSWFLVALILVSLFVTWLMLVPYVSVFVLAGTLAFLFYPLYQKLLRILRYESLAAFVALSIVGLIVLVPLVFFGQRLFAEATTFYASLVSHGGFDFITSLGNFLHLYLKNVPASEIVSNLNEYSQQVLAWFIHNLGQFFSGAVQGFFLLILTILGLFYSFKEGARIKKWLLETVPLAPEYTEEILHEIGTVGGSVVRGTFIVAILFGIIFGVGFVLFNIPNPLFFATAVILASVVPIVGPWLVLLPAIAYLLFTGQTVSAIGLTLWSLVFTNLVSSGLAPQLMRRGVNIHSYLILLSIVGGVGFFGPIGFLMGPFVMTLLLSSLTIYRKSIVT